MTLANLKLALQEGVIAYYETLVESTYPPILAYNIMGGNEASDPTGSIMYAYVDTCVTERDTITAAIIALTDTSILDNFVIDTDANMVSYVGGLYPGWSATQKAAMVAALYPLA